LRLLLYNKWRKNPHACGVSIRSIDAPSSQLYGLFKYTVVYALCCIVIRQIFTGQSYTCFSYTVTNVGENVSFYVISSPQSTIPDDIYTLFLCEVVYFTYLPRIIEYAKKDDRSSQSHGLRGQDLIDKLIGRRHENGYLRQHFTIQTE
jgi:hypothetical protein